jgi:hypothetical protein
LAATAARRLPGGHQFTLSQRIAGNEVIRVTGQISAGPHGDIIYPLPAAWVRELPVTEVKVFLTAREGDEERQIGTYTQRSWTPSVSKGLSSSGIPWAALVAQRFVVDYPDRTAGWC